MAVSGSRKRSANVGHHLDGTLRGQPNGTDAFVQHFALIDPATGEIVSAGNSNGEKYLAVGGRALDDLVNTNLDLLKQQQLTNRYLSLLTNANLGEQDDGC